MWFSNRKNSVFTSKEKILDQMSEMRPLPMGRQEFDEWFERIQSGANVPCTDMDSLKYTLAGEIMHLGPTESHKQDAFFIHRLRKLAVNEVAISVINEIKDKKAKEKAEAIKDVPIQAS